MPPEWTSTPPKGRSDIVFRQLDDEWVLYDPVASRIHALNISAAFIWSHCDGRHTAQAIASGLASAFGTPVPEQQARTDVDATLRRFFDADLLEKPRSA